MHGFMVQILMMHLSLMHVSMMHVSIMQVSTMHLHIYVSMMGTFGNTAAHVGGPTPQSGIWKFSF